MSDYLQLIGKRFRVSKHVDAVLSFAVFMVSLAFYTWHWFTAQRVINHDSSRLGLYALDLLEENIFSLYVYHQYSPNPFIIYVDSLVFAVFGYSQSSVQSVTVVGGALTAPAVYWVSRWLFEDRGIAFARRAGLIAALGLALSVIFSSLSRSGLELILLPAVEAAAVAFLWRGLRRGRKLDFVLSGLLVGVSQYVLHCGAFFSCCAGFSVRRRCIGESSAVGTLAGIDLGGSGFGPCCFASVDSVCHLSLYVWELYT